MTSFDRRSMLGVLATLPFVATGLAVKSQGPRLRFEIYKDTKSGFRWRLKSGNGQTIATSGEAYTTKAACRSGIELVQKGAASATIEDRT